MSLISFKYHLFQNKPSLFVDQSQNFVHIVYFRSVSFILALSSMAFLLLGFCYVVIDVKRYWSGAPFFYPGKHKFVKPLNFQMPEFGIYILFNSQGYIGTGPQHYGSRTHTELTACDLMLMCKQLDPEDL